jgi:cytoskeletal protein CcmA (bactofilin family)
MNEIEFKELKFNLIGKNSVIKGDLELQDNTIIAGKVYGDINLLNNANLIIDVDASVEGNIFGKDIEISGHFQGQIHSSGNVTAKSQSVVEGKILAKNITIYPGAQMNMETSTQ